MDRYRIVKNGIGEFRIQSAHPKSSLGGDVWFYEFDEKKKRIKFSRLESAIKYVEQLIAEKTNDIVWESE